LPLYENVYVGMMQRLIDDTLLSAKNEMVRYARKLLGVYCVYTVPVLSV